jgi:alpha-tubulin suppressor-like RCC1 family protein
VLSDSCKVFTVKAGSVKVSGCSSNKEVGERTVETNGSGVGRLSPRPLGFTINYKPPYEGGTTANPASTTAFISLAPANPDERETKKCPTGTTESNLIGSIAADSTDGPGSTDSDVNGTVSAEICVSTASGAWALEPGTTLKFFEGAPSTSLWGWGYNANGQVGNGMTTDQHSPVQIGTDTHWAQVSTGEFHTVAIKTDGTLWAWGFNGDGELGNGTTTDQHSPVQIGIDTHWAQVSAGAGDTLAIKTDGTLWAWGANGDGQLGDGTTASHTSPVQIGTDTHWARVSTGPHTVAIKTDGTLWAWGLNSSGELGDGTTSSAGCSCKPAPEQIGSDTHWVQASVGVFHTAATKTDGTLWTWGENNSGQLGNGTFSGPDCSGFCNPTPTQVGSDTHWAHVAAGSGGAHNVAIKTDGTLWAWGLNSNGQLGDNTTTHQATPEQIGTDTDWAQASAGDAHTMAIKTDGTLWAWGWNVFGQLGDGTTSDQHTPERIGTNLHWAQVSAGTDHTAALQH